MVKSDKSQEMSDSEIIALLGEYSFKEKEMSGILKNLKSRDFESVVEYVESIKNNKSGSQSGAGAGATQIEDAKQRAEEIRKEQILEEESKKRYRERIMAKIKANQKERQRRDEQDCTQDKPVEKTARMDSYIRVMAVLNGDKEVHIGLGADATVSGLFDKLKELAGSKEVVVRRYGHSRVIECSDAPIVDYFKARAFMLDVSFS